MMKSCAGKPVGVKAALSRRVLKAVAAAARHQPVTVSKLPDIFGAVGDGDEVLRRADDTPMGLVGDFFAQALECGLGVSEHLEAGLNTGLVSSP
jgi:hypothetical protein